MDLKFYISVSNRFKLNVRGFLGANFYVPRSYRGKTGRRDLLSAPE